jgi:hypothetical protein
MTIARRGAGLPALAVLCGGLLGPAAPAMAQGHYYGPGPGYAPGPGYGYRADATPNLDRFLYQAEGQLREGMRSGSLTPREADRIRYALDELRRHEWDAKRDGVVTAAERESLREHAAQVQALIQRETQDWQTAPPYGQRYGWGWNH